MSQFRSPALFTFCFCLLLSKIYQHKITALPLIRNLPCTNNSTGEIGICTFNWSCLNVAHGIYIGHCVDRFFIGICCKIPEKNATTNETNSFGNSVKEATKKETEMESFIPSIHILATTIKKKENKSTSIKDSYQSTTTFNPFIVSDHQHPYQLNITSNSQTFNKGYWDYSFLPSNERKPVLHETPLHIIYSHLLTPNNHLNTPSPHSSENFSTLFKRVTELKFGDPTTVIPLQSQNETELIDNKQWKPLSYEIFLEGKSSTIDLIRDIKIPALLNIHHNMRNPVTADIKHSMPTSATTNIHHDIRNPILLNSHKDMRNPISINNQHNMQNPVLINNHDMRNPVSINNQHNMRNPVSINNQHNIRNPVSINNQHNMRNPVSINMLHDLRYPVSTDIQHNMRSPVTTDMQHNLRNPVETDMTHDMLKPVPLAEDHDYRWPVLNEAVLDLDEDSSELFQTENILNINLSDTTNFTVDENNNIISQFPSSTESLTEFDDFESPINDIHELENTINLWDIIYDTILKNNKSQENYFSTINTFEMSTESTTSKPNFASSKTDIPEYDLNFTDINAVCGRPKSSTTGRIVGGRKSHNLRWPWMISLQYYEGKTLKHKCGATLLNQFWAATAAHCVDGKRPQELMLRLGEHNFHRSDYVHVPVDRHVYVMVIHPDFNPSTYENDLALLRFEDPVQYQANIVPICLPSLVGDITGRIAVVTGWGKLSEEGELPGSLHEVYVPVLSNNECEKMYSEAGYTESIGDVFVCAGLAHGGLDACEGDSGGPMVMKADQGQWILVGLISWGISCAAPKQPGVYTRISQFKNWIDRIINH